VQNPVASTQGTVSLTSCTVTTVSAYSGSGTGAGGAFYLDTVRLSLFQLDTVTITGASAELNGGVIYVGRMPGQIVIRTSSFTDFIVDKDHYGSFLYSGFETAVTIKVSISTFTCSSTATAALAAAAILASTATRAGAFYVKGSVPGVTSIGNTFTSCVQC